MFVNLKLFVIVLLFTFTYSQSQEHEAVQRVRKAAVKFFEQISPYMGALNIHQGCTRACGTEWLKCFKQKNCKIIDVKNCVCSNFAWESPMGGVVQFSLDQHLERFGVTQEDIDLIRNQNDVLKFILTEAYDMGLAKLEIEQLVTHVIEAANFTLRSYTEKENCINGTCLAVHSEKLSWGDKINANVCFLSIKGSEDALDWADYNLQVDTEDYALPDSGKDVYFHKGFSKYAHEVQEDFRFKNFISNKGCDARILTGHSRGAGAAHILSAIYKPEIAAVYLFAVPNVMLSQAWSFKLPLTLSLMHAGDVIQAAPPSLTRITSRNFTEYKDSFQYREKELDPNSVLYALLLVALAALFFLRYRLALYFITVVIVLLLIFAQLEIPIFPQTLLVNSKIMVSATGMAPHQMKAALENHSIFQYVYTSMRLRLCGDRHSPQNNFKKYESLFRQIIQEDPNIAERDKNHHVTLLFDFGKQCV